MVRDDFFQLSGIGWAGNGTILLQARLYAYTGTNHGIPLHVFFAAQSRPISAACPIAYAGGPAHAAGLSMPWADGGKRRHRHARAGCARRPAARIAGRAGAAP